MTLAQILTGLELIIATTFGQPDTAIVQKKAVEQHNQPKTEIVSEPVKAKLETSVSGDKDNYIYNVQKFETELDGVVVKYDYARNLKNNPNDVFSVTYPDIYKDSTLSVGGAFFNVGNLDGKDEKFLEAVGKTDISGNDFTIIYGRGFSKDIPTEYAMGIYKTNNSLLKGAALTKGSLIKSINPDIYVLGALDLGEAYFATGYSDGKQTGFLGVKDIKDFGTFTFANYDYSTGNWSFKTQTGFGNVSKGFYSTSTFDFASSYITIPTFHKVHFSPLMTKGDFTWRISGHGDTTNTTLETMLGMKTGIIDFGIGYTTNNDAELELYKTLEILGVKGSIEFNYTTNGDMSGYLITNVEL